MYSETSDSGPSEKRTQYKDLSTRDTAQGPKKSNYLLYSFNTLTTSKKRTTSLQRTKLVNLYCPQRVLCSEVPLYMFHVQLYKLELSRAHTLRAACRAVL